MAVSSSHVPFQFTQKIGSCRFPADRANITHPHSLLLRAVRDNLLRNNRHEDSRMSVEIQHRLCIYTVGMSFWWNQTPGLQRNVWLWPKVLYDIETHESLASSNLQLTNGKHWAVKACNDWFQAVTYCHHPFWKIRVTHSKKKKHAYYSIFNHMEVRSSWTGQGPAQFFVLAGASVIHNLGDAFIFQWQWKEVQKNPKQPFISIDILGRKFHLVLGYMSLYHIICTVWGRFTSDQPHPPLRMTKLWSCARWAPL